MLGIVYQFELFFFIELELVLLWLGARGSVVLKALCYKPEGRGFDIR
jgi:hypothetical protein